MLPADCHLRLCSGPALNSEHFEKPFILLLLLAVKSFDLWVRVLYSLKLSLRSSMCFYGKFPPYHGLVGGELKCMAMYHLH